MERIGYVWHAKLASELIHNNFWLLGFRNVSSYPSESHEVKRTKEN